MLEGEILYLDSIWKQKERNARISSPNILSEGNASTDSESNNRTHANLGLFPNIFFYL